MPTLIQRRAPFTRTLKPQLRPAAVLLTRKPGTPPSINFLTRLEPLNLHCVERRHTLRHLHPPTALQQRSNAKERDETS